nr:unnamed protein product [Digitaria exilis]
MGEEGEVRTMGVLGGGGGGAGGRVGRRRLEVRGHRAEPALGGHCGLLLVLLPRQGCWGDDELPEEEACRRERAETDPTRGG